MKKYLWKLLYQRSNIEAIAILSVVLLAPWVAQKQIVPVLTAIVNFWVGLSCTETKYKFLNLHLDIIFNFINAFT
jgi:hypothetical protein